MDYDDIPQLPPSPPIESIPKRRKRAIQAITTIIETKEFPYSDDYLWKNNGNTTHRKSGLKSVYYKCSNSARVKKKYIYILIFLTVILGLSCE